MVKAQLIFMQTFVDDLLTLKEIPVSCVKFVDKAFNPNAIFKLLGAIFETEIKAKNISLLLPRDDSIRHLRDGRLETMPLPRLVGDKRRFLQVMINLLKIAKKFTPSGGTISVIAAYEPLTDMLTVDVADTGAGITAEDFPKLFTRFGKLQRTAQINSEGIGLGLKVVKHITSACYGTIEAFSEGAGRGTCFTFTMRMRQENVTSNLQHSTFANETV